MSTPIEQAENWLSNEFQTIVAFIAHKEQQLAPAITIAENLLNGIKSFEGGIIGKGIELVLETYIPASTGLINAFKLQLPIWLIELNWLKSESDKSLTEQWEDALSYLNSISNDQVKASQYNTLKALFIHFFGTNSAEGLINIQQALVIAQPSHDSTILS